MASRAPERPPGAERSPVTALSMVLVVVLPALWIFLAFVADARVEPATFALMFAGATLVYALYSLFRVAQALSRPSTHILLQGAELATNASRRQLREEKKRVLKAIKELDFDHAMGKIGADDHRAVRERYEARAIEVMRALDEGSSLHPELLAVLATRDAKRHDRVPPPAESSSQSGTWVDPEPTMAACGQCAGPNDPDARFCKHCGARLTE